MASKSGLIPSFTGVRSASATAGDKTVECLFVCLYSHPCEYLDESPPTPGAAPSPDAEGDHSSRQSSNGSDAAAKHKKAT